MSTPRDRDPQDPSSGEGPGDGSDWHEPAHLGGDQPGPREEPPAAEPWTPPGWDLPDARGAGSAGSLPVPPVAGGEADVEQGHPARRRGLFGLGGPRRPGAAEQVFTYEGDLVGAQHWAVQHGWTVSDGTRPEDAVLADLVASSPVRAHKDHRAAGVLRGMAGTLELVAFDVVYTSGNYRVPQYAVTAAPLLRSVPGLRLSPARLWKHGTAGLVPVTSGNEAFDTRWQLFAAEDGPEARRLADDPAVQGLLLATDDGDEFWTAAGHLAAIRPDGHRPSLIEHHARLLTAMVGALTGGWER